MTSTKKLTPWQQACAIVNADPDGQLSMDTRADIIFRASCKKRGLDPLDTLFTHGPAHVIAFNKLTLAIIPAVVGTWVPDWNDSNSKYGPWFWMNKPGFRFCVVGYGVASTTVAGGSRLCFDSRKKAEWVGRHCISLYRDLMGADELAPIAKIAA